MDTAHTPTPVTTATVYYLPGPPDGAAYDKARYDDGSGACARLEDGSILFACYRDESLPTDFVCLEDALRLAPKHPEAARLLYALLASYVEGGAQ